MLHPKQEDIFQFLPQNAPIRILEIQRIHILVAKRNRPNRVAELRDRLIIGYALLNRFTPAVIESVHSRRRDPTHETKSGIMGSLF
jgi:hypothetical protein